MLLFSSNLTANDIYMYMGKNDFLLLSLAKCKHLQ